MNRDSVDWKGYIPAITTPSRPTASSTRDGWGELVEWMVAEGMHGIAVAGTTGEWFSLLPEERVELFRLAADVVDGRITVLGGCMAFTPREVIAYAGAARARGWTGSCSRPRRTSCRPTRDRQLVRDRLGGRRDPDLRLQLASRHNVDMQPELLARLAEIPNVVAIKNSTGDFGAFVAGAVRGARDGALLRRALDEAGVMLLQEGADGTLGAGAVLGSDHPGFFDRVWGGDLSEALRLRGARPRPARGVVPPGLLAEVGSPQTLMKAR